MRSRLRIALSLVVVSIGAAGVVLPGCGSSTPSDDCMAYFAAYCDRVFSCTPELVLDGQYATDPDTCAQRLGLLCPTLLDFPHTNLAAGYLGLCASDIAAATCDEWINQTYTRNACNAALRGNEPAERPCVDGFQCQSQVCIWPPTATGRFPCGKCSRLRIAGQSCTDTFDTCDLGLSCNDGTCGTPKDVGERCSGSEPCAYTLICDQGRCAEPLPAGSSCNPENDLCNLVFGEFCDSHSNTCGPAMLPYDGGECYDPNSGGVVCSPGFYCNVPPSGRQKGYCDPTFADGTTCTVNGQDPCMPPASCIGTCELPTAATCN